MSSTAKPMSKSVGIGDSGNETEINVLRHRLEEHESRHLKIKSEFESLKLLNEEMSQRLSKERIETEKQIKELKLDLRIAKRDADKWHETNRYLRDEKKEVKDQLVAIQSTLEQQNKDIKAKDQQIQRLMDELKTLQNDFNAKQLEQQSIKDSYEERAKGLANEAKALREQLKTELNWKQKYDESNRKTEQHSKQLEVLQKQLQSLKNELSLRDNAIEQKDNEIKKLKNNNKILKEECNKMDKQLEQFKAKYLGLGAQKQKILADKDCTLTEVQKLHKELETLRIELKSAQKQRDEAFAQLETERIEYQNMVSIEKQRVLSLEQTLERESQKNREYEERFSVQEQNIYSNDEIMIKLDTKISHLEEQLIAIKEEAAKHITTIGNLKDANQKLSIAFQESIEKVDELQDRIDSLHHQLEIKEEEFNREKITNQGTIGQQLKLIDFLQNKVETLEKQKKPLFSITPTKKIVNNSQRPICPIELKDLDKALAEEKTKNRRLVDELNKLKGDANYYKNEVFQLKSSIKNDDLNQTNETFRKPLFSENKNNVNKTRVNNKLQTHSDKWSSGSQRMHHNIPHRFVEITNKLPNNKCVSCAETIHFGRKAMKCSECNATTHQKCSKMLPNNCGLPVQMMQQLFHSSNDVNDNYFSDYESQADNDVIEILPLEPSAPEETFTKGHNNSDSSATTDNNDSDIAFESQLREIKDICDDKENGFSFTDSMIEILQREEKS